MIEVDRPLTDLPAPPAEALAASRALTDRIAREIAAQGPMPFSRFMQLALYDPHYGYYMAGQHKFGAGGDFVTAPEISPLFSYCLAAQCAEVLSVIPGGSILEIGGGSGVMAVDILGRLERLNCLPDKYYILELSAELRERQRRLFSERAPKLLPKVEWLQSLEGWSMRGVMLGNEVLDAMPVERFRKTAGGIDVLFVDRDRENDCFVWLSEQAGPDVDAAVRTIESDLGSELPDGYCSELNLNLSPWVGTLAGCLEKGVMLLIDYGYPRREYYAAERDMGTLMCHYRHHAHGDPFRWVGLQDITAHVDFTAVAEGAATAGLTVAGFTSQAEFLLAGGIDRQLQEITESAPEIERFRAIQGFKTLIMPTEMGERFKMLAATRDHDQPLAGFSVNNDRRHYL
ncbi:MAG TPA: SAM-dependent methyltransferase [Gammaproteobacteria bacterium]